MDRGCWQVPDEGSEIKDKRYCFINLVGPELFPDPAEDPFEEDIPISTASCRQLAINTREKRAISDADEPFDRFLLSFLLSIGSPVPSCLRAVSQTRFVDLSHPAR